MSALASDEYEAFCEGLRALTRIDLSQYKRGQMERRIRTFVDRRGVPGLAQYLDLLRRQRGELDAFLDRVTINVSQLWRNPEQWRILARKVLPELAESGRVRAWSAGASYGAEAYTLAATTAESIPRARVEILGTDIDRRMVDRARRGRFSTDDARDAPRELIRRWFDEVPDGGWEAKPELKARCRFEQGDLLRVKPPPRRYELVLCRNTVIYFAEDVRDALHARIATSLRPGGYLMVGCTERVNNPRSLGLEPVHPFTYQKQ